MMPDRGKYIEILSKAVETVKEFNEDAPIKICLQCVEDILELLKEQRWIPVAEKLPKNMANKVIVYLQHNELVPYIGYGHYEKFQGEEMWYDLENNEQFSERGYTVTHWMPMPLSPEGEKWCLS